MFKLLSSSHSVTGLPILPAILLLLIMSYSTLPVYANPSMPGVGEKLNYVIKNLGVKVGTTTLEYKGETSLGGRDVHWIHVRTDVLNFVDDEEIYFDRDSFYPLLVKRDILLWGKKEVITEIYDDHTGKVRIVKQVDDTMSEQIIEKLGRLDNIYCFIYRYRMQGHFKVGESLDLNLPTKSVEISVREQTNIKAAGEKRAAWYLESDSKEYRIWFDTSANKIPLRIDGAVGFGKTSMMLLDYEL